ncbi:MAG: ATP-binding protein [Cyanobacteria bacterium J06632_3]
MKPAVDPNSIQFRLTVGMVVASVLGIGSLTSWLNFRMEQIFVARHKDNALMIAGRLGQDANLFEESMVVKEALAMAIDYREQPDVAIWVLDTEGKMLAKSDTLNMGSWRINGFATELMDIVESKPGLEILKLHDRHLVSCASPLKINGQLVGQLYVVDDITEDNQSLAKITKTLALSSLLAIGIGAIATALYVNRALNPIRKMNRLAGNVSAENLATTQLKFEQAPTEVQELAQTCNMMLSRLSAAWEQQKRFVSDVSHELRTPLTLVHGYLQSTLRRGRNLTAPQREGLEIAADEADRTIRMLQDLLDLARADGGNLHFQIEQAPMEKVVQEILERAYPESDRIKTDLTPATARTDRNRLKQILTNLIDNALKYSEDDQPIYVTLKPTKDQVHLEVRDQGRGIPPEALTNIFDPFYRVDEDRSRATGGTGLGLSIVKTLVEGMNGTIKAHSTLGEGSTFTVSLPA